MTARIEDGENLDTVLLSLKKLVHGEDKIEEPKVAENVTEEKVKRGRPKKEIQPISENSNETPPTVTEKKTRSIKNSPTKYDINNQTHKNQVGELLSKSFPDWRKTPDKAKAVSRSLSEKDFLDEEGLILQSFKDLLIETYTNWKG